jgi:diguanylate cyclase (GGDEF)-like protein/putative nucleotidyltransferase with HDIG domain
MKSLIQSKVVVKIGAPICFALLGCLIVYWGMIDQPRSLAPGWNALNAPNRLGWSTTLLLLFVLFWLYRSYRLYLLRQRDEQKHVEEMASLHLRTIEALALAIEAKDHTTHEHLRRVRVYALALGEAAGLTTLELEALRTAALLHDIGKLAVPEHIISKPGRLTPEEFEKMKIHPVVGAEILERVQFPCPVVPIVRAHHEKWDGSGYPDGLKGDEIPIGARILGVVDCLDALASDRQYRSALPLHEAMAVVEAEAGKLYDPKMVALLKQHYIEWEQQAHEQQIEEPLLSQDVSCENAAAPAAGFESEQQSRSMDFLLSIAAARQEVQMLYELTHDLGASLSVDETLSVVCVRLKKLVPYDSIAVYVLKDGRLIPEHVTGDNLRLFSSLRIPLGEGVSGWVAQNRKPIVNGNPSAEPGYLNDPTRFSTLRSAVSVPLQGLNGMIGVLTLYHADPDFFTADHLRILLAVSSKIALSTENALKYRIAESSATTDYLTGLPNARSLFLQLDREIARCKRMKSSLTLFVCDLDGFKQVNDRYGHLEGNKVLRTFAGKLKENCREYDYVARMGGDEFVLLVPGMTAQTAQEKIARIQRFAAEAGSEVCGSDLLSLSVGRASYPEGGTDAEQLLAEADRQMYKAKQQHYARMESAPMPDKQAALPA